MNEVKKNWLFFACGLILGVSFVGGLWLVFDGIGEAGIRKRIDKYAERSADAQSLADRTERELEEVEGKLRGAGEQIAGCATGLGELADDSGRIAETNSRAEEAAGRIESGILELMQIVGQGKDQAQDYDRRGDSGAGGGGG
ncbi:MAG: hypothetical protein IK015_04590 [Treponema sp.]|nr:hypothetical protein [Treponema sp.]